MTVVVVAWITASVLVVLNAIPQLADWYWTRTRINHRLQIIRNGR